MKPTGVASLFLASALELRTKAKRLFSPDTWRRTWRRRPVRRVICVLLRWKRPNGSFRRTRSIRNTRKCIIFDSRTFHFEMGTDESCALSSNRRVLLRKRSSKRSRSRGLGTPSSQTPFCSQDTSVLRPCPAPTEPFGRSRFSGAGHGTVSCAGCPAKRAVWL